MLTKTYKTPEEVCQSIGFIKPDRLLELAKSGYAPHYYIDGQGPLFKIQETRDYIKDNLITVTKGIKLPTRLSVRIPPFSKPREEAPTPIKELDNLRHIDPSYFRCPGVYFLCEGNEVVYVGQSVNVPYRIMSHIWENKKEFDETCIFYLPVPESELLKIESGFINKLKPKYNTRKSINV